LKSTHHERRTENQSDQKKHHQNLPLFFAVGIALYFSPPEGLFRREIKWDQTCVDQSPSNHN